MISHSVIQHSFGKRRNRASGAIALFLSIGCFTWPPIVRLAIDTYCWQGALLLMAAINLNVLPFIFIIPKCNRASVRGKEERTSAEFIVECPTDEAHKSDAKTEVQIKTPQKSMEPTTKPYLKFLLLTVFYIGNFLNVFPTFGLYVYYPIRCVIQGYTKQQAAIFLSTINIAACILRIPAGIIGDLKFVNLFYVCGIFSSLCGVSCILSIFCSSFLSHVVFCIVFGVGTALSHTYISTLVYQLVGKKGINVGLAIFFTTQGLGISILFPLSGKSYILWFWIPVLDTFPTVFINAVVLKTISICLR